MIRNEEEQNKAVQDSFTRGKDYGMERGLKLGYEEAFSLVNRVLGFHKTNMGDKSIEERMVVQKIKDSFSLLYSIISP